MNRVVKLCVIVFGIKERGETQKIINTNTVWGVMTLNRFIGNLFGKG